MTDLIQRAIDRSLGRIRTAFRAVLTNIVTDTPIQLMQAEALSGEQLQDNELMQHYGFTSAPLKDTQAIVLPIGGKTAHGIIIATEHTKYRLRGLKNGEVAIYDDQGQSIVLTRGGMVVDGAGLPILIRNTPSVTADTPSYHMTGNLQVDGDILNGGNVTTKGSNSTTGDMSSGGNITAKGNVRDLGGKSTMAEMRSTFNGHHHDNSSTPDRTM